MSRAIDRKEKSNKFIKSLGIDCLETLPLIESSEEVKLKTIDDICKRVIASFLTIQLAFEIEQNDNYEEAVKFFEGLLDKYNIKNCLLPSEKKLFNNKYKQSDILNITWNYETIWALLWALNMVNDMDKPFSICDVDKIASIIVPCESVKEFKESAKLKDIEEILDMLDLYYRYHWVVVDKELNPETNIGKLNPDVVWERRKGLEWLISNKNDWDEISLDT